MADIIFGELKTETGHSVAAGLSVEGKALRLATKTEQIGAWPIEHVRLEPIDSHTILITVSEETVAFLADDADHAKRFLEARRLGSSSLWVATGSGAWERAEARVRRTDGTPRVQRLAPIMAAVVSAAVALFGFSLMQSPADAEPMVEPETATTEFVVTTVAVPAGVPEVIAPPGTPLVEVTRAWNTLAGEYETGLTIDELARSATWDRISLELSTTEFGMLSTALLTGDPQGDGHSDRRILVAMGQLVGSVDESLDGPARRAILARLGLDIGSPRIEALDGTTVENGVEYHLWYDASAPAVHLAATVLEG